jgi:hypothetical protein
MHSKSQTKLRANIAIPKEKSARCSLKSILDNPEVTRQIENLKKIFAPRFEKSFRVEA